MDYTIILQALWIIIPAYVSNASAVLVGGGTPIDFGKNWSDGKRILGDGKTWRGLLSGTFIDIESVTVPAGMFENCLHFELKLPLGETSYEATGLWFAPNAGLVKAEKATVSMGEVLETITDELKEYDIK